MVKAGSVVIRLIRCHLEGVSGLSSSQPGLEPSLETTY